MSRTPALEPLRALDRHDLDTVTGGSITKDFTDGMALAAGGGAILTTAASIGQQYARHGSDPTKWEWI
jgi:hypothetical protein